MVAYVKNANGAWNSSSLWTPNGIPGQTDTVTLGSFTTSIPSGYTALCGGITSFSGTNTTTRSTLEITGILQLYGAATQGIWSTLSFIGTGKLDLRGNTWTVAYTEGGGKRSEVISDGTGICEIYSSTTLGNFTTTATDFPSANLNLDKFYISNIAWSYGGSWQGGNTFTLKNGVFYNCGEVSNFGYMEDTADWIMENVDFRGSQSGIDEKAFIFCRSPGGPITGIRRLQNITFDYDGIANAKVRLQHIPTAMQVSGIYTRSVYLECLSVSATFNKLYSTKNNVVGEGGFPIREAVISTNINNPHTMQGLTADLDGFYLESIQPPGSTDAGDHFILQNGGTSNIRRGIINDNWGGAALNALGVSLTGTHTMEHMTIVADIQSADYGIFARNENSGVFNTSSTITVRSNIAHLRSNPSGVTNIRVFNLETAGDDQIDVIDNNLINGFGTVNSTLYFGVTSATKGVIGSQAGWGLNDIKNVNPNFIDPTRSVQSWASQFGATDYDTASLYVIDSVNGYNRTTHKQTSTASDPIPPLLTYLRAGYTPTNAAIATAAHDGTTIGALAYAPSIDTYPAFIRSGSTGNAYTTTGLSSVSSITIGTLAATAISDTSGDGTHSVPSLTDGVAHELYGIKTITINGTGGSPTTTALLNPLSTQNYVTLSGTLNTTNTGVLYNFSPAAVVGDQIVFLTANNTSVDAQGNLTTDLSGTQQMWHIQASTKIARSYDVTTGTAGLTATVTGVSVTASVGTLTATLGPGPALNATVTGVAATTAVGTLSGTLGGATLTANVTGVSATTGFGSLLATLVDYTPPDNASDMLTKQPSISIFKNIFKRVSRKLYTKREK